ncbi:PREDICTED: carbohydrate sulfotransferase 3 [Drosophila arizonae]|uniref:Carbohydrate sulfotransferase 3 n=1 Tax=Drosophila arizonae TaxID=7263 RepID=A0ABM1NX07_DROAR|nr:PREDICTED: carbohydrate sulfotransferase 3 [Drosophila arizonae]
MVQRSTKFTGICIAIYLTYTLFVFFILPLLLPDPVTMSRNILAEQTQDATEYTNFTNITLESGGQPLRSILVTFHGSGVIGLLEELSRLPGAYHHFSPLIAYKERIKERPQAMAAVNELHSLLNCDYNRSLEMIKYGMKSSTFRKLYGVQYKTCLTYTMEVCSKPETLSRICKIFPFINMSVYNLGLLYLKSLLEFEDLNVRMILIVRDPRATMSSRDGIWCSSHSCSQPEDLCKNMVEDYQVAEYLLREYPHRFGIVRYEELVQHPLDGVIDLYRFYGLPTKSLVDLKPNFTITQAYIKYNFELPYSWKQILTFNKIVNIQDVCSEAMALWGYKPITEFVENMTNIFVPLKNLPLFLK